MRETQIHTHVRTELIIKQDSSEDIYNTQKYYQIHTNMKYNSFKTRFTNRWRKLRLVPQIDKVFQMYKKTCILSQLKQFTQQFLFKDGISAHTLLGPNVWQYRWTLNRSLYTGSEEPGACPNGFKVLWNLLNFFGRMGVMTPIGVSFIGSNKVW